MKINKMKILCLMIMLVAPIFVHADEVNVGQSAGEILKAYDDLGKKSNDKGKTAGMLLKLYDDLGSKKLTVNQVRSRIAATYKEGGVTSPQGYGGSSFTWMTALLILVLIGAGFLAYKKRTGLAHYLSKAAVLGKGHMIFLVKRFIGRLRKNTKEISEILDSIKKHHEFVKENYDFAKELKEKFENNDSRVQLKTPEYLGKIKIHHSALGEWLLKTDEILKTSVKVITTGQTDISSMIDELKENKKEIMKKYRSADYSAEINGKITAMIKALESESSTLEKDQAEILGLIKSTDNIKFQLGDYKEFVKNQARTIEKERDALIDLIVSLNKSKTDKVKEDVNTILESALSILNKYSQKAKLLQEILVVEKNIFEDLEKVKFIHIDAKKLETEIIKAQVKELVARISNNKDPEKIKESIDSLHKMTGSESERIVRIALRVAGIDKKTANAIMDSYKRVPA